MGYKILNGRDKDNIAAGAINDVGIGDGTLVYSAYNPGYGVVATAPPTQLSSLDCSDGCLFDIRQDPDEKYNLMDPKYDQKYDDTFFLMKAKLDGHKNNPAMNYRPKRTGDKGDDANNRSFIDREGCFKTRAKGMSGRRSKWPCARVAARAASRNARAGKTSNFYA